MSKNIIINFVRIKYKQVLFLFIFFVITQHVFAQKDKLCVQIKNKKAISLFNEAVNKLNYNYHEAYLLFKKVIEIEPYYVDAYYIIADINYRNALKALTDIHEIRKLDAYYTKAEKNFLKVTCLCPSFQDYTANFYLGEFYYDSKNFSKAKEYFDVFIENSKEHPDEKRKAKTILKNINIYLNLVENPVVFNPVSINGVCTKNDEFLPLISPDGEYAFYTRRYKKITRNSYTPKIVEEFTYSIKNNNILGENNSYTYGVPMPLPFNDGRNQGAVSITIDNKVLFITICDFVQVNNRPYKNCDIYYSVFDNGNWSTIINLGNNINAYNTWEGQPSVSSDGNILYFASAREGGFGGIDIYKSIKDENGNWRKAINLGDLINTKGDDKSPFIHSDNHTLYFSSNGRYGMGGFDIYYSEFCNNEWSEPVNIGYPINTKDDDIGFIVSADGKMACFSSNKIDGVGGWDIYSFELYEDARPKDVLFVKGQLMDDKGDILTDAKVHLKNVQTSRITDGLVDKMTGKYAVAVSYKKDDEFIMTVKKKHFAFNSEYIVPSEDKFEEPAKIDFEVKPIEVGTNVKLNNIYFAFDIDTLDKKGKVVLDNFIEFLNENPTVKIKIGGHTDNIHDADYNLVLSNRRAKTVHDYLLDNDVQSKRVSYDGFGERKPIADNNTSKGRALNRRTEFIIIGK
ncbi:MAG: PD40 domain-containing protein [Bacteroidales bacterium]|nr:PD40 domain-containing protein [Bacteroidales bacterium]